MRAIQFIGTVLAALVVAAAARGQTPNPPPPDPTGIWQVAKGYAHIRIVNCEERLWGVVAWEARPGVDSHNPDPNLRTRPTLGMPILLGMAHAKPNRWDGEIYNSTDGHTYSANISMVNPDTLRVQGCFLAVLCGGENWTRVKPSPIVQGSTPLPYPRPSTSGGPATPPLPETDEQVCSRVTGVPRLAH